MIYDGSILIGTKLEEGFVQLITNPKDLGIQRSEDDYLFRTRKYLHHVLAGDGSRPYCPFVELIEENNGYHIRNFPEHPSGIGFDVIVNILGARFKLLSPRETYRNQPVDITTVVAAFAHPYAMSEEFCSQIDEARNHYRQDFLDQGLMIAQMHPHHQLGGVGKKSSDDPLYVSGIPLLMVRRMHQPDNVFMKLPREIEAYMKYFGGLK